MLANLRIGELTDWSSGKQSQDSMMLEAIGYLQGLGGSSPGGKARPAGGESAGPKAEALAWPSIDMVALDQLGVESVKERVQDALWDVRTLCLNVAQLEKELAGQALDQVSVDSLTIWDMADESQRAKLVDAQSELELMLRQSKDLVKYLVSRCGGVTPSVLEITGMGITGSIHREIALHHLDLHVSYEPVTDSAGIPLAFRGLWENTEFHRCRDSVPNVVHRENRVLRSVHGGPSIEMRDTVECLIATAGCSHCVRLHEVFVMFYFRNAVHIW